MNTLNKIDFLLKKLFNLNRSLISKDNIKTLNYIKKEIPINIIGLKSGTKVFDWKVPKEWIIDEAYIDFSTRESWVKRLRSFPNLIITQTLSKAYGMAGIRLGIALASAEIIDALKKIKPPYNINELSQQWAIKALKNQTSIHNQTKAILEQRKWLEDALQTIPYIKEVYPSDANFILVRVDDAILRYEELLTKGIVVRNRSHEIGCAQCLRISVGTYNENIFLLNALQR